MGRLAALAEVSAPTVSHFGDVAKKIQLSSALSILGVLVILDKTMLNFTERIENYRPERDLLLSEDTRTTMPPGWLPLGGNAKYDLICERQAWT